MNFFERQHHARTKTRVLVFYFVLALLFIIIAVNGAFFILSVSSNFDNVSTAEWFRKPYWIVVTLVTLLIIGGGSMLRLFQLRKGGRSVASMLGARPVPSSTHNPQERQLRNIVEEMSIASGMPVPELYVLDQEGSINAFVAGYKPTETVMVVTRGTLEALNRDELQGVIGHEFSHIFHGDMRINIRLIGILAGILAIGQLGLYLIRSLRARRHLGHSGGRKSGQSMALALGAGLTLFIIGYTGLFFGRLIKAAISRQREFLADASSVQYTRNPTGIAGALWKIQHHLSGSKLSNRHAEDLSHMCFSAPFNLFFKSLLATHPPLDQRIRAIAPDFQPTRKAVPYEVVDKRKEEADSDFPILEGTVGFANESVQIRSDQAVASVGNPAQKHALYAAAIDRSIPDDIRDATHTPHGAAMVIYAMVLSKNPDNFQAGLDLIKQKNDERSMEKIIDFQSRIRELGPRYRLPLVDLAIPALKSFSPSEMKTFLERSDKLIKLDRTVTLFEFMLQILIRKQLNPKAGRPNKIRYRSFDPVLPEISLLLSALAYAGGGSQEKTALAYSRALGRLTGKNMPLRPRSECTYTRLKKSIHKFEKLTPFLKSPLINACMDCAIEDGRIKTSEAELLRAISASLDCPMPPLIE